MVLFTIKAVIPSVDSVIKFLFFTAAKRGKCLSPAAPLTGRQVSGSAIPPPALMFVRRRVVQNLAVGQ